MLEILPLCILSKVRDVLVLVFWIPVRAGMPVEPQVRPS